MDFVMSEAEVAERTGLSAADVAQFRKEHLYVDQHWQKKGREVRYSQDGLEAILGALGVHGGQKTIEPEKEALEAAGAASDAILMMEVERVCPNPLWVQCRDGAELKNVRVHDNRRMRRGTRLQVRLVAGGVLEGRPA